LKSEGQTVRVIAFLVVLTLCLTLIGCKSSGAKTAQNQQGGGAAGGLTSQPTDTPRPTPTATPPANVGGIIAGQVVDNFNRTPPAEILIALPSEGQGAPVYRSVPTDEQGYFTIVGVKAGQQYQLIARSRDGKQAGTLAVSPPNARVIIRVSEETPAPAVPGGFAPAPKPKGVEILEPIGESTPKTTPIQDVKPDHIVEGDPPRKDVRIDIPGIKPKPPPPPPPPSTSSNPRPAFGMTAVEPLTAGPSAVPSCLKTGDQLTNFALAGLDGRPWEYKRDRVGKLVLLDFWKTTCPPCRASIQNHLLPLTDRYGRLGLEVIGIAYEDASVYPTFADQQQAVTNTAARLHINYRILMGSGWETCPVRKQFAVGPLPTLVLINDDGKIVWRSEGLSEVQYESLKVVIKKELGIR
jgi:thiol-disulfide isomerase/thioredoxin